MDSKWQKDELVELYIKQGKNLAEIADIKGTSRERVRQVIKKLGIASKGHYVATRFKGKRKYSDIEAYFQTGKDRSHMLHALLLPEMLFCCQCGSRESLHVHHLFYPALSLSDIQVLCASCHRLRHNGLLTYQQLLELVVDRIQGMSYKELSLKYNISLATLTKTIQRMRGKFSIPKGRISTIRRMYLNGRVCQ